MLLDKVLIHTEWTSAKWPLKEPGQGFYPLNAQQNQDTCILFIGSSFFNGSFQSFKGLCRRVKMKSIYVLSEETKMGLIKKKVYLLLNWLQSGFSFLLYRGNKALGKTKIFAPLPKINIFFNGKLTSKVLFALVMVWPPTVHSHVQSHTPRGENLSAMNVQLFNSLPCLFSC